MEHPVLRRVAPTDVVVAATGHYLAGRPIDMSALAVDLGISRATLYRRVGNHEALLGAVLARQTELTWRAVRPAVPAAGTAGVVTHLVAFVEAVTGSQPLRRLIERDPVLFVRTVMGPGEVEDTATALVHELVLERLGDRLQERPGLDAKVLARAIVRVADSMMYSHLLRGTEPEVGSAVAVTTLLLDAAVQPGEPVLAS